MTLFWLSTVALTLLACGIIIYPLLQKNTNKDDVLRDELNKAFYKDRLSELKEENDEGLVNNEGDLIADLKQSLLDDIPEQQAQQKTALSPWAVIVPSVLLTVVLSYALYAQFGASNDVEQWHQVNENLPELSKKLMGATAEPLSDDEMQDLILALRTRLHYNSNDATGWLLLGRLGLTERNVTLATDAMRKAYQLKPNDNDIKLGLAQALMMSQDEMDQSQARALLGNLIQQEQVDIRVFSLLAFDAFERQDFKAAIRYWRVMQQMLPPEDGRYEMLTRSIASAQKRLGETGVAEDSVTVTIEADANALTNPNAVLIVSAHDANGSPIPVAAARYPLGAFPRTLVIDDSNSMMEGQKLSSLKSFIIRARIDTDGNVATREGDWYGESDVTEQGEPVKLLINKQY
ncbi:c-type cytochrome biogenesis protein CcmI [Vibrio sp. SM6]|uniref:C-type cytochrome biogenesis protein CcmI n=1 Tax=Vibrio agarilyticus TaxID=2726741 RepID=A0A7X8TRF8_9VIBR|nr:c-type cytochrome biogenesis protein CcmI [Vibrio agarilyticus]NLS13261.1 c-type cytochrome biogenesis protein CcmI [Vibrio agarilyticus]